MAKKRFTKSKSRGVFGGVFAGLSEYLNIEAYLLRTLPFIATVLVYLFFGSEAMMLIILAMIVVYAGYWATLPNEE